MEPSFELKEPFEDPAYTFRATSTAQMFTVAFGNLSAIYDVGIPSTWVQDISIRNNTLDTLLETFIQLPSYLKANVALTDILLQPSQVLKFQVTLIDSNVREKAHALKHFYQENIVITAQPDSVTGQVYIRTDLPALTL